jgi:hypothetical protein
LQIYSLARSRKGCLYFFIGLIWFVALVIALAFIGPVGVGIVVAAFITWLIIRKKLQKNRKTEVTVPAQAIVLPPKQLEYSEENGETVEKDE